MLTMGWDIKQFSGANFFNVIIMPYFETQIELTGTLEIKKLFFNSAALSMGKFKSSLFYSSIFKENGQMCLGFGYASDEVKVQIHNKFDFPDCYKTTFRISQLYDIN